MEGLTGAQRMRGEPGQFLGLMVWVFPTYRQREILSACRD